MIKDTSKKGLGHQNVSFLKLSFHAHFTNTVKPTPHISTFNLTNPYINFCACRITEPNFGGKKTTFEKFQFYI